jgi:hypothetical protein
MCDSVIEHLPSIHTALESIPSAKKEEEEGERERTSLAGLDGVHL